MQREFWNEFRPEVGQRTALTALINVKQRRKEEISAYIMRFDLVCTRFVGTLLNDDTLKYSSSNDSLSQVLLEVFRRRILAYWWMPR